MKIVNFLTQPELWDREKSLQLFLDAYLQYDYTYFKDCKMVKTDLVQKYQLDTTKKVDGDVLAKIQADVNAARHIFEADFDSQNVTLFIAGMSDKNSFVMQELNGVCGYTFGNATLIYLNESATFERMLLTTLVHELSHTARFPHYGEKITFLDRLIFEGLADTYVKERLHHLPLPIWTTTATQAEILGNLPRLKEFWLDPAQQDADDWFFGDKERGIPHWLGYATGFHLVQKFREKNPDIPWPELITIKSEEFLQ